MSLLKLKRHITTPTQAAEMKKAKKFLANSERILVTFKVSPEIHRLFKSKVSRRRKKMGSVIVDMMLEYIENTPDR